MRIKGFFPAHVYSQVFKKDGKQIREVATPFCFDPIDPELPFLVDHKDDKVLSDGKDGRASIRSEKEGIFFALDLPSSPLGRAVLNLAQEGTLGVSPQFKCYNESWDECWDRLPLRRIRKGELIELSLTEAPVYLKSAVCSEAERRWLAKAEKKLSRITFLQGVGLVTSEPKPKSIYLGGK